VPGELILIHDFGGVLAMLPGGQMPRKVKFLGIGPAWAFPPLDTQKWPKVPAFETCNMLYLGLDMYSSAPIKDMGRRGRSAVDELSKFRRLEHDWNGSPVGP
jgi:hypothetical protein